MDQTLLSLTLFQVVLTAITAIAASSGFWAFINRKRNTGSLTRQLLIGLAHDRIVTLSLEYIHRSWVTQEEHENLIVFLVNPYLLMGGNGSVLRITDEVNKLPIRAISLATILKEKENDVK
jgi:hypothetical protein